MYDFKEVCCICLNISEINQFPITDRDTDNVSYLEKLEKCVHKKVEIKEDMKICRGCIKQLSSANEFIKTVLQAIEIWSEQKQQQSRITFVKHDQKPLDEGDKSSIEELILKIENSNDYEDIFSRKSDTSWINAASYYCSVCIQNFPNELELINHNCPKLDNNVNVECVNNVELTSLFPCKKCNLSFNKRYELIKHRRIHQEQQQQQRSDVECETSDEKKYVCTFCNKSFKQSYHLREHITSHTGEKNFSCNICMKKFQRMSSQRRHMKTHEAPPGQKTKKTPFLCTICGKTFPYSNGAQRHMRIHLGVKRYECSTCGKKFSQSTHLHVHQRTHTGEKPYICDVCGDAFALNATLQKHRENHSKDRRNIVDELL